MGERRMKIMIISDLHYDRRIFHGIDQSKAWSWLLGIVDYHRPDYLLSCGDWGEGITREEFHELLRKTTVLSIFGNHENMEVLPSLYNVRGSNYLPVLMEDGKVYEITGLRISGISGIIASKRKVKKGVPRRVPEDLLEVANALKDKGIDVLLLHEAPALKEVYPEIRVDYRTETALKVIEIVRPRVVFNGHLHWSPYSIYRFSFGTLYVRIDSSQKHKCYAIIRESKIEIWRDNDLTNEIQKHFQGM